MFNWFFGNRANSHFSKVLIRIENLLKNIDKTRKTYSQIEQDIKKGRQFGFTKQFEALKKRLSQDMIMSKEVEELILVLDKNLIDLKNEISEIESYISRNDLLKELGNIHVAIKVINNKFNNLKEFLVNIENLEQIFDKLIADKTSLKSINAEHFKQEIYLKIQYLFNNINSDEINKKHDVINEIEHYLKEYAVVLKEIKSYLNSYWYEYQLIKKLYENHKKGKRDSDLIESVFGKSESYNFNRKPHNETDLVNKLIFNMRQSMSEDEINRVMHRLRYKLVDKSDFLTRGVSDKEAKIFASTISDMAGPLGIQLRKNNTADGYGFLHASEHFAELIDIVNPKFSSVKSALEKTLKDPKFNIPSRGCRFLCTPISRGRFFLVAITNPSVGFITFYHMDDSPSQKGLLNSLKMMVRSGDLKFFKSKTGDGHYILLVSQTMTSVYVIEYQKREDGKVNVLAKHISKSEFSEILKNFSESDENNKLVKFIDKNRKRQITDLHALAA